MEGELGGSEKGFMQSFFLLKWVDEIAALHFDGEANC
jgi:hypothetical protein